MVVKATKIMACPKCESAFCLFTSYDGLLGGCLATLGMQSPRDPGVLVLLPFQAAPRVPGASFNAIELSHLETCSDFSQRELVKHLLFLDGSDDTCSGLLLRAHQSIDL